MSLEYITTVIIAAYNSEETIERAIQSALDQGADTEVIVVDDCSTDATYAVSTALASEFERLKVVRQSFNQGPSAARNRALKESRGVWVTPLDADDYMKPGRLAKLLNHARKHRLDMVGDDILKVFEGDLAEQETRLWSDEDFGTIELNLENFVLGNLAGGMKKRERSELGFLKPIIRREFLDAHDLTYKPELRLGEDFILYTEALLAGIKFEIIDPAGYVAVVHENSLSGSHRTEDLRSLLDIEANIIEVASLTKGERDALDKHVEQVRNKWAWRYLIDSVKDRNPREVLRCFAQSPSTSLSLVQKLSKQAVLRSQRFISPLKTPQ